MDSSSPTEEKSNGPKSPTKNGNPTRPDYDRTDTGASGWATDNESEDKEKVLLRFLSSTHVVHPGTC